MIKVKASEFQINCTGNSLPEVEMKGFVFKMKNEEPSFSDQDIRNDYLIIMTEREYREKILSRSGKKSNPLMMSFEDYNND